MRIRSIRPEFWRSDDITSLPLFERLMFIGIWSYVDDNGVGIDRVADIAADLFAHDLEKDPHGTLMQITGGLMLLAERGLITRYSVENRNYLHVSTWETHQRIQRPSKSRYPLPDAPNAVPHVNDMSPHANESLGEGEKGRRGEGEKVSIVQPQAVGRARSPNPTRFDEFWNHYPRKVRKDKARTAYTSASKRADEETIIAGAIRLANDPNLPEKQFIPHPTTWLNGGGWDDEPLPPRTDGRGPSRLEQNINVARQMWEAEQAQTRLEIEQ